MNNHQQKKLEKNQETFDHDRWEWEGGCSSPKIYPTNYHQVEQTNHTENRIRISSNQKNADAFVQMKLRGSRDDR